MKILVVAPHPDDEVLGCGGTIAKYAQKGDQVYLCIVTKAYTPEWSKKFIEGRTHEITKANKILGVKKTFFLDFPTVKLDTISQKELNRAISNVIEQVHPDIAFIPHSGDLNRDHRLVFESSLVALRPLEHAVKKILTYETVSETEWGEPLGTFSPNYFVDISETFDKKTDAMKAYKSELRVFPHPRSLHNIKALAKVRAGACGVTMAEAFHLIRGVWQ
ncbi:MAG: LmbE family protein [Candidatus Saganbacteria bacterium]|uniref:LmbE family protein n=1 Tax=Candidatus Saganbacteria bacterium TaxID=2575572 RepID=A0A833L2F0_UNCSA|nr:MAG: LmbE family protein [Candidatus Saganbacteria bacterium]